MRMPRGWPMMADMNISKIIHCKLTCSGQSTWKTPLYKWLTATAQEKGTGDLRTPGPMIETTVLQRENEISPREACLVSLYVVFWAPILLACWWGRNRYGFTRLGRARPPLLTAGFIWRPVLGFRAGFSIWSQLWPAEGRMLLDDWWLWADRKEGGGREDGGWNR